MAHPHAFQPPSAQGKELVAEPPSPQGMALGGARPFPLGMEPAHAVARALAKTDFCFLNLKSDKIPRQHEWVW